jgi:Membrane carboxypeptidase/penicillin-binding protein
MPERSTVYDVDGKIYSRLAGANRLKVSLSEVSPEFIAAVLAREDTRFYDHKGIDWRGVLRALSRDVVSMKAKEGASSLTMQLARNSLPLGGRTFSRKLLEAMVALRIEREFTKQQILELYVNRIYFGSGCYGVETASQAYFGRTLQAESFGSCAAGGSHPWPESFLAAKKSRGRGSATRRGLGPYGGTEKNYAITGRAGQKNKKSSRIRSECHRSRRTMRWTPCSAP